MYIILPSNSPAVSFPDNTSSNFTIPLPRALETPSHENWKVGLIEIQIPITFYNLEEGEIIHVWREKGEKIEVPLIGGVYTSLDSVIEMINHQGGKHLKLNWHGKVKTPAERIEMPQKVAAWLEEKFEPWTGFNVILVQCDLIGPIQTNQRQLPVLQSIVPSEFKFGNCFTTTFYPIEFHKVLGESHRTISVKITDLDNNPLKFRAGSVVLKLKLIHE